MKTRPYSLLGAIGFLFPFAASFLLPAENLKSAVLLICQLLCVIFFFGYFLRCGGKALRAASLFGAVIYLILFAYRVSFLLQNFGISFLYSVMAPLYRAVDYLPVAVTFFFCLAAMFRNRKDMLNVVLCTLSIVACVFTFYPVIPWESNVMLGLLLLYYVFRKPKL